MPVSVLCKGLSKKLRQFLSVASEEIKKKNGRLATTVSGVKRLLYLYHEKHVVLTMSVNTKKNQIFVKKKNSRPACSYMYKGSCPYDSMGTRRV